MLLQCLHWKSNKLSSLCNSKFVSSDKGLKDFFLSRVFSAKILKARNSSPKKSKNLPCLSSCGTFLKIKKSWKKSWSSTNKDLWQAIFSFWIHKSNQFRRSQSPSRTNYKFTRAQKLVIKFVFRQSSLFESTRMYALNVVTVIQWPKSKQS